MKASELRIGNWIFDLTMSPVQVRGTGTSCIWISENGPGTELAFTPIPLTEEWLVKFGFDKREQGNWDAWFIGINRITHDWLFDLVWLKDSVTNSYKGFPFYRNGLFEMKYVHQLQNLYFALTGEELTIKAESAK